MPTITDFLENAMKPVSLEPAEFSQRIKALRPELRKYVETDGAYPMLRHPLVFVIPFFADQWEIERANKRLDVMSAMADTARQQRDWFQYLWCHERAYRFDAFIDISRELSSPEYWGLLADVWTDAEYVSHELNFWIHVFSSSRPEREHLMTEEERDFLQSLPDTLTVFRGYQKGGRKKGLSWTLDRDKAVWFAKRNASPRNGPLLATATVMKKNVIAFLDGRDEKEVVIFPRHLKNISVQQIRFED